MAQFDLPRAELETYAPILPEPDDLDAFWKATLAEVRSHPLEIQWEPVETGLTAMQTWDVSFPGFAGHPVRGWFHLPTARDRAGQDGLPVVIQYHGYGGGRGLVHQGILWAAAGYAHFVMDTRGQGSAWSRGDTADPVGSDPSYPGFMTRGILNPRDYYYRRVFSDAVRAVDAIRSHAAVDRARVAVTGISQGGGISLAMSALVPEIAAVMPDVPFLSNFPRALEITEQPPYTEITRYLAIHRDEVEQALRTLSYFDAAILARRATAPALFSVALMDQIAPPSTVFAAYNAYAGPKRIAVYPYNDHEGGDADHVAVQLRWLAETLG